MQYDIIFLVKKILLSLFIFIGVFLFLPQFIVVKAEQIQNFDSTITINKDATIVVSEKIVYDFGDLEKHGIYREIPSIKTNAAGKKFKLEYSNFSVVDELGKTYQFSKTSSDEIVRLKIGDPNRTITGVHTYIISYKVAGALTYFSDHDEFYWNVTGNSWPAPITNYTSQVELPTGVTEADVNATCYTGPIGSTEKNCLISKKNNSVLFIGQTGLQANEGFTIVIGIPIGNVAVVEPKGVVNFWETPIGKMVKTFLIIAAAIAGLFWYLIYPIWIPIKWYLYGRDPSTSSGPVQAWFDPPKAKNGRLLTPEEVGGLVDENVDYRDLSGMIVYLAQKGFLRIEEREKKDFYLVKRKNYASDTSLLAHQKYFLEKLFADEDEVRIKDAKLYDSVQKTTGMIYTDLVTQNFFPKNPNSTRIFYSVIGGLALPTLNLLLAFCAFAFGRNMPKKTAIGAEAANVAKSLKNFLTSQERQLAFQAKNQMMFEKLLPYAIAFGVEKIWAKRFEDIKMRQPDWYHGYGGGYYTSSVWVSSMNSSFSSFRSAATPTSSSSGFSSGFSGGSSGGGGGGGGGGSW